MVAGGKGPLSPHPRVIFAADGSGVIVISCNTVVGI